MPLNTVYLPKVDGLQTETSNINSDPRSLSDCIDIIANREDFLESRHGHPSAPVVTSVAGNAVDLYAYRNEVNKVFVPIYKVSNVYQFKTISQPGDEITTDPLSQSTLQNINGISTTRTSQVNTKPVAFAHDERLLFLTDYGMYFRPYSTPGTAAANKVDFPVIRTVMVEADWVKTSGNYNSDIEAENNHWLVSGFQSNFKIVFEIEAKESTKGERRLISAPSRIYEVKNFNLKNDTPTNRTSNMLVNISNLTISHTPPVGTKMFAKVYRTTQFKIGDDPITEYHLAIPEIEVTSTSIAVGRVTVNDDIVKSLDPLYNDTSQGGFINTNHLPLPAKNVTQFRNYYIYSNLCLPVLTTFGITKLPGNADTLTIKISGANPLDTLTHQVTFKTSPSIAGDVLIPSNATTLYNDYIREDNTNDLTYQGLRPSAQRLLNIVTRIVPGTGQGQVEPYGKLTKIQYVNKNGNTATVRVYPSSSGFDINRFKQPGIAAIVNDSGVIQSLFSYNNYKRVASSSGFIDFEGAISVGSGMPADQEASLTMYYIPGESVANLSIYKGTTSYFSFLPCKNGLPYPVAKPAPVNNVLFAYTNPSINLVSYSYLALGTVVTVNTATAHSYTAGQNIMIACTELKIDGYYTLATASGSTFTFIKNLGTSDITLTNVSGYTRLTANNELLINPDYIGLLTKPQGKLLDELAIGISDEIQRGINQSNAIIALSGGEDIENGIVTVEILDNRYEKIEFIRNNTSTSNIYEPPVGTSYTEFTTSEKSVSSFIISKENNPELIPYGGNANIAGPYSPPKVGDPSKAIVACAATKDSVYFLKEDGVARVFIGFGALIPTIQGINIFDNTTFCVSAGSVQVLNDSVLFLAQNGIHAITGNDISKVSRSIETELKKVISQCRNENKLDSIRSFSNSAKGLYGLHIPLVGTSYVTYVLNVATMRWTKWSNQFNGAVTDLDGRLTTLVTDQSGNYIRQDKYTNGDPRAEIDQIDDEFVLTGSIPSTAGLIITISLTGLGDKSYRFGSKQVYYKAGTTLYPITVARVNANQITATFETTPPTFSDTHVLVVGVNSMMQFQPFTNNNPSVLKMYSGFHIHTEESVLGMAVSFRTEARSTFNTVTKFSTSPDNRTVYRCYIPLEAVRGRFLYRKITHTQPYQICAIPAQAIVFRDTGSERVNKSQ